MAARALIEGVAEDGMRAGLIWAIGGFLFVLPISAIIATVCAWGFSRNPEFFVDRVRWPVTLVTGLAIAVIVIAGLLVLDRYWF